MARFSFVMFSSTFKSRVVFQRKQLFGFSNYYKQRAEKKNKKKAKHFQPPDHVGTITVRSKCWHHCDN